MGQLLFLYGPGHFDEHTELHGSHLDRCSKHQIPALHQQNVAQYPQLGMPINHEEKTLYKI